MPIPLYLLEYTQLKDFWKIFSRAYLISPPDSEGYPTVSMIDTIGGTVKMEREEFWECVLSSITSLRSHYYQKRKLEIMKAKARRKN